VSFAFELMQDAGLVKPKARPEGNHVIIFHFCKICHQVSIESDHRK